MNFDTETGSPMSCHEKVTGTCHSERSEESEVGHAARLVRPDASLPLSMTREGAFFTACRMLAPRHRSTAQATRKGWPYERRGSTGGTNASSIVGPPLAGGLPGAHTALS